MKGIKKFTFLRSTIDAFDAFLRVPDTVTRKGSHIRDCNDLKRVMIVVVIALIPCLLFGMYNTGLQHYLASGIGAGLPGFWQIFWYGFLKVLPLVIVSYVVGLGIEFTVAQIRGHEVNEGYLVTGMLIPLIMPVTVPLWMLALAVAFAVIIGKEIFGGTGMNIWNPALLARAFLFFSYPSHMSGDDVWTDGFSGATPLAGLSEGTSWEGMASWRDMFLGFGCGSFALYGCGELEDHGFLCSRSRHYLFVNGSTFALSPGYGRIRVRLCFYGHRSGYQSPDGIGEMGLRPAYRRHDTYHKALQPGISRGNDAFHPAYEYFHPPDRPLRCFH